MPPAIRQPIHQVLCFFAGHAIGGTGGGIGAAFKG